VVIGVVIVATLALVAIAWILVPVLRGRRTHTNDATASHEAGARKRAALDALVEIEEELEIGKLSPDDFVVLRSEYEREALRALKELDALAGGDSLEEEIAAMRRQMMCPNCGALRRPGEACSKCDAPA
jgi:cytochrome c-type biogenesis protein CcmI